MDERYKAYLQSDWWHQNRKVALERADKKCECCKSPIDIEVHHLTYEHLGFERAHELVCLCKRCHEWIEEEKRKYRKSHSETANAPLQMSWICKRRAEILTKPFFEYCLKNDLCSGGKYDLENNDIYKKFCEEYEKNNPRAHTMRISEFRDKLNPYRYKVILSYYDRNYPKYIIRKYTGFSMGMITKVYNNPEEYRERVKRKLKEDNNNE